MKQSITPLIQKSIETLQRNGQLPKDLAANIQIDRTRNSEFGDFGCNIALSIAKEVKQKPQELAQLLVNNLPSSPFIKKVMIAGPGFINFYLTENAWHPIIEEIFEKGDQYGHSALGNRTRVHIEFVSANPTGPLHVGHGRGAAYGAAVADILAAAGFDVHREYYVNDAGRQMDILAVSVWLRYLQQCGETITFPKNAYQGDYVVEIAEALYKEHHDTFKQKSKDVFHDIPADEDEKGGDKEAYIDGIIVRSKILLGPHYSIIFEKGLETILEDIRQDLEEFGVYYQEWFSEKSLVESGKIKNAISKLQQRDSLYEREGAIWFRSTDFGDDKDRVVKRANGQSTYFASDIAYHFDKYKRGFHRVIDVLGADHHGYAPRIRAVLQALDLDPNTLSAPLVQFAILYRGETRVQMSTRSGSFVTLRELREEVGNDAARFFYVWRKCEQHMDFDLDLAKSQSNDNPVYYIQYGHARICSVMRQLSEKKWKWDKNAGLKHMDKLVEPQEKELLTILSRYPETLEGAAIALEPHLLAHYLRELANVFHVYYNSNQFLVEDEALRNARLCLINATRQVIKNGLKLLGVSAPESM